MKKLLLPMLAFLATAHSTGVLAEDVTCSGKVDYFYVMSDGLGRTMVYLSSGAHAFSCQVNAPHRGVPPEVCVSWLSLALTAKIAGKELVAFYSGVPTTECNLSKMGWPVPEYVRIQDGS